MSKIVLVNKEEVGAWLFNNAKNGHISDAVVGEVNGETVNVMFINRNTKETIKLDWKQQIDINL